MDKGLPLLPAIYGVWLGVISFRFLDAMSLRDGPQNLGPITLDVQAVKASYVFAIVVYFVAFTFWLYPAWERWLETLERSQLIKELWEVAKELAWLSILIAFGILIVPVSVYLLLDAKDVNVYHLSLGTFLIFLWLAARFVISFTKVVRE